MQHYLLYFFSLFIFVSFAQGKKKDTIPFFDSKYKEDQFYVGLTYNFMNNKPQDVSQQGFSGGFQVGFIRDLPVNKKRNMGFGVGLGYATNSYNHNLLIQETANETSYSVLNTDTSSFSKNKLNIHSIELPIQFRWRNSTMTSHKFWRVYAGVKFAYVFNSIVKHKGDVGNFKFKNPSDVQKLQMDLDLSFGWNTWNFYLSYGLQPLFKDTAKLNGETIKMSPIKFGLFFYIF